MSNTGHTWSIRTKGALDDVGSHLELSAWVSWAVREASVGSPPGYREIFWCGFPRMAMLHLRPESGQLSALGSRSVPIIHPQDLSSSVVSGAF